MAVDEKLPRLLQIILDENINLCAKCHNKSSTVTQTTWWSYWRVDPECLSNNFVPIILQILVGLHKTSLIRIHLGSMNVRTELSWQSI